MMRPRRGRLAASDVTQAAPVSRPVLDLSGRPEATSTEGKNAHLSWAARSDVGSVREHNEDSYLVDPPLFAVCDGMGGHAAGEVASSIAIRTLAEEAPKEADAQALGEAVEAANAAVIAGPARGEGREGMGCTCTTCVITNDRMAVAHVGDSRLYLLHKGMLVRVTHDHSLVEELVDAGEITADEARTHPNRSWVTRALGSDPDMYADRFDVEVEAGERIIICSDGLSSMIEDAEIEDIAVSTASPAVCVDALVTAAIVAGGHDNVTCVVIDIVSDGIEEAAHTNAKRTAFLFVLGGVIVLAAVVIASVLLIGSFWYLSGTSGRVAVYQGIEGDLLGLPLSNLNYVSEVELEDLPESLQNQLAEGIPVASQNEALATLDSYRQQIAADQAEKGETASAVGDTPDTTPTGEPITAPDATSAAPLTTDEPATTSEPVAGPIAKAPAGDAPIASVPSHSGAPSAPDASTEPQASPSTSPTSTTMGGE